MYNVSTTLRTLSGLRSRLAHIIPVRRRCFFVNKFGCEWQAIAYSWWPELRWEAEGSLARDDPGCIKQIGNKYERSWGELLSSKEMNVPKPASFAFAKLQSRHEPTEPKDKQAQFQNTEPGISYWRQHPVWHVGTALYSVPYACSSCPAHFFRDTGHCRLLQRSELSRDDFDLEGLMKSPLMRGCPLSRLFPRCKTARMNGSVLSCLGLAKAGGVGINLTAATHVVHFDRCWNPAKEAQARYAKEREIYI